MLSSWAKIVLVMLLQTFTSMFMKLTRVVMAVNMPFEKTDRCSMMYSLNVLLFHCPLF